MSRARDADICGPAIQGWSEGRRGPKGQLLEALEQAGGDDLLRAEARGGCSACPG